MAHMLVTNGLECLEIKNMSIKIETRVIDIEKWDFCNGVCTRNKWVEYLKTKSHNINIETRMMDMEQRGFQCLTAY